MPQLLFKPQYVYALPSQSQIQMLLLLIKTKALSKSLKYLEQKTLIRLARLNLKCESFAKSRYCCLRKCKNHNPLRHF